MISSNALSHEESKTALAVTIGVPSSVTADVVSLKNYQNCTVKLVGKVGTNLTTGAISLLQCTSVAGTTNKALTLNGTSLGTIYINTDYTASDALTASAITAASTSTPTTTSKTWKIEIPISASQLDVANGYDCVQLSLGDMTNVTCFAEYYLTNARYGGATPPTAITD